MLPERLPDGGAAAAAATVNARQGELRAARTRQRSAASLLKEHRKAQEGEGKGAPGRERGPHPGEEEGEHGRDQDRDRGHEWRDGGQPPDGPGRSAQGADQGADQGGDGSGTGFTELDVEPLMPPLWGQSPAQHEEEIQDYKQALSQDRAISQEKIAAFTAGRRAKSAELAGLVPQLTQQINGVKAAALGEIGSAETSGVAAVRTAVRNARSRIQAQARLARAQVEAGHSAAVAGMGASASGARTAMDSGFRTAGEAVTGKQDEQITRLGELYGRTEQRIRDAAKEAGDLAAGEGKKRAEQYRAKMIHRDDNWWDGPLTDNRCKARADAATAVGDAYRKELPKAADDPIADMKKGRPDAEKTVRQVADDVRESLDTVLQQSKKGLADGHQQSVQGAADAKTASLQGIGQALGAAEASLAQLQSSQIAAIRGQAAQQRQAVERNAAGATAAVARGVTTARDGLDRSLRGFLKILGQDETPDPEQLEEVLRNTGAQFDERLEGVAEQLRSQAGQAGASLAAAAKQAARGMAETARSASESAVRTATSTGETLTSTASRTVSGLRQVQQSFARTAKTMQSGYADANKQVLEGLDKAYTDLAGKFEQGADGQVKAIADALKKAATGTGKDEIHPKITEEADKAAAKVKPRWHTVLTFIVVIVVVIALTIALGPLVIGAVGAIAGTLGASAAVAGVIGTIVGGAIVGAAAGAVGAMVSNVMNGAPLMEGVGKAALFGAIGGAIGGGASAAVAKTALGTVARVTVEMVVEVAVEVGLEAGAAAITGQQYSWQQAMLTAATTVAATGVMANPRVQALTHRVQLGSEKLLGNIRLKVPESLSVKPPEADAPDAPKTPDTPKTSDASGAPDAPGAPKTEVPTPDAPSAPKPDTPGPTPDGGTPGGTPQPGRGPDGATSWKPSDIDPTGGQGSADGPVRPRDQAGIEAELRNALGPLGGRVDLTVDPDLPGRTVRVHYDLDGDGLITNVRMIAGPNATPTDIQLHTPTARTMLRYSGLSGRVRNLLRQVGEWIGVHGKPPVGTRAWEAHLELRKLPDIIADRARIYADAVPAARAELESELASLTQQLKEHAQTLKEWNLDPGRGYVAAERPPKDPPDYHEWYRLNNVWYLRRTSGNTDKPKMWYDPDTGKIEPDTGRGEERFPPNTGKEEAFELLGGKDPQRSLRKFIEAFAGLNIDPEKIPSDVRKNLPELPDGFLNNLPDSFIDLMPDPGGRPYRPVRSQAKEPMRQWMIAHITSPHVIKGDPRFAEIRKGCQTDQDAINALSAVMLRDLSANLTSADRGSVGERWYQELFKPEYSQVTVTKKEASDQGIDIGMERHLDKVRVEGNDATAIEVKNYTGKLDDRAFEQLDAMRDMVGVGMTINVKGKNLTLKGARVLFPDYRGLWANRDWMVDYLSDAGSSSLRIEVYNSKGERTEIYNENGNLYAEPGDGINGGKGVDLANDTAITKWLDGLGAWLGIEQ
ncbi:hypothetical protein ABT115_04590 [Streptomyces sp. NPDC001832]|uniref:hypothetical protein n=1 Tax=Streptomyces sp. NPDC001832 TaxID=3154527 RepID=UPI003326B186